MKITMIYSIAIMALITMIEKGRGEESVSEAASTNPPTRTSERNANADSLKVPFRIETDESNAALQGRQCAVIWFASESKAFKESAVDKEIVAAPLLARALGVSYSEEQFRQAFKQTEHKVAEDFNTRIPEMIGKEKGERVRDIYLFSYGCTASRMWVSLVPLWNGSDKQDTARLWVATPLAMAYKVAGKYDQEIAAACRDLGERSLGDPLGSFDLTDKFANEVLKVQKKSLSKYMTEEQVYMVTQPFLMRKQ
jgi:hypothetical protein